MLAVQAKPSASLAALRATIFQQAHDPLVAQRVYDVAVAARSLPTRVALPWLESAPVVQEVDIGVDAAGPVAHAAHDICVVAAFVGAEQADKAAATLGSADWRLVCRLGGWQVLHSVAPHFRRRHLQRHLPSLLRCPRTGRWLRATGPLRPAKAADARRLLATSRETFVNLNALDEHDLTARPVSLGALAYLLGRFAPAMVGRPHKEVCDVWFRLLARCPVAVDDGRADG